MKLSNSMSNDVVKNFNLDFFKKIENNEADINDYINFVCSKHKIIDGQEINALIIYYFWNFYFNKFFPNVIEKKFSPNNDPRKSSLFKYCYKLQKETKGILTQEDYKDYVYCQLKFIKIYKDKTNNAVLVSPNILNLDKGWKKWKYFKYLMSKNNQAVSKKTKYINNENLKISLMNDKKYLVEKIGLINKQNIFKNSNNILFWHKLGNISVYFLAICNLIDKKDISKDLSVYKFDENGIRIYNSIFTDLI